MQTDNWKESLVEELARELYDGFMMGGWEPQDAYPILREAIRRTLEKAADKADEWANSHSCTHHDDNPCCHVRTGAGIAAALRQLMEPGK